MYYSVTFIIDGVEKNTWDDWRMIPSTPPMIPPPTPNLNYVDIPGRRGGPLDLTGVPFNKMTYQRMAGSWTFYREPETPSTRKNLYEELITFFTGKAGKITLEEDVDHYYVGRISVDVPKTATGPIQFILKYDIAPIRYNSGDDSVDTNYASETVISE